MKKFFLLFVSISLASTMMSQVETPLFVENFSKVTEIWYGNTVLPAENYDQYFDNPGWTGLNIVLGAPTDPNSAGAIYFNNVNKPRLSLYGEAAGGYLITPAINCPQSMIDIKVTLKRVSRSTNYDTGTWDNANAAVWHAPDGVNFVLIGNKFLVQKEMTVFTLTVTNATSKSKFKISNGKFADPTVATPNRIFVGSVVVVPAIPTFSGTGEWTDAARWNTGIVPGTTQNVIIDGTATINSNVEVADLTINTGKSLTVNAGKQLTVGTSFTNNGILNLKSDATGTATILTPSTISGSGTTNVEQWLTVARQWWYLSSPLSGAKTTTFTPSNRVGNYDEPSGLYSSPLATDIRLEVGKGYVVKLSDGADKAYTFTGGSLNTGEKPLTLTRTGIEHPKRGFHLIGNPYPSYLDWNAVYTDATNPPTNMRNAFWFRTLGTSAMTFHTYGDGDAVPETTSPVIAPMQGFWVKVAADGSNGTLTFKNTHRKHFETGANQLKVKAADVRPRLRLAVFNGTATDETLIVGKSYASNDLDAYDIEKMSNDNVAIPEIFSVVSNQELVINSMNELTEGKTITLGFRPGQAGTNFSIEATQLDNIDAKVMLLDKVAGTEQELTPGSTYTFEVTDAAAATTDRFVINLASKVPTGIENGTASGHLTVYANRNNRIQVIYNGEINLQTTVSVYNVTGQKLASQKLIKGTTELNGTYRPGVYMVQLTDGTRNEICKLIIN